MSSSRIANQRAIIERRGLAAAIADAVTEQDAGKARPRVVELLRGALDAGREEIAIARKGVIEADKPLLKDIAALGVTVTQLSPAEREAFVKATRPVYEKWKGQIGADLVTLAEKSIAARKK